MSVTPVTGPGRVAQFLWGSRGQNTLTFAYPAVLDVTRFWREPRLGSEQVVMNNLAESWTQARDYKGAYVVRWMQLPNWSGHAGFQAFLDWAVGGNAFAIVPDAVNAPLFQITGCLLIAPFTSTPPRLEPDGSQMLDIVLRSPTYDLGLAWR